MLSIIVWVMNASVGGGWCWLWLLGLLAYLGRSLGAAYASWWCPSPSPHTPAVWGGSGCVLVVGWGGLGLPSVVALASLWQWLVLLVLLLPGDGRG